MGLGDPSTSGEVAGGQGGEQEEGRVRYRPKGVVVWGASILGLHLQRVSVNSASQREGRRTQLGGELDMGSPVHCSVVPAGALPHCYLQSLPLP